MGDVLLGDARGRVCVTRQAWAMSHMAPMPPMTLTASNTAQPTTMPVRVSQASAAE